MNLALSGLPLFRCLPEDRGQHRATIHLLPDEAGVLGAVEAGFAAAAAGRLPDFPTIEMYCHSTVDATLSGGGTGAVSAALFVQWVPHSVAGSSWEAEEGRYVAHLLSVLDRFAPGEGGLAGGLMWTRPGGCHALHACIMRRFKFPAH